MSICWNCSAEVPEQSAFCPNCGKSFAVASPSGPQPSPPGHMSTPSQHNPYPAYYPSYPTSPESRLERKVDGLRTLVLLVLALQVFFLFLLFT